MDPNVLMLLSNSVVKLVFNEVLSKRRVQLKDLLVSLTDQSTTNIVSDGPSAQEKIEEAVQKLKNAKLIDVRPAEIKDFSTYYVTANGLNAERELRLTTAL